jgi:hypothetical protein
LEIKTNMSNKTAVSLESLFMGYVHPQQFKLLENTMFQKVELFLSSDQGRDTSDLLGPLERAELHISLLLFI